jgi:pSer/pThr/pTyr-binding forkhead associated (FHA) protein
MLETLERRLRPGAKEEPPEVVVHQSEEPDRSQRLPGACYRIGRDPGSDIVIDHGAVSRRHALLERRGGSWLLRDNGSTNGLWWNGRRVRELLLNEGDTVRFGPSDLTEVPELEFHCRRLTRPERLARITTLGLAAIAGVGLATLALGVLTLPIRGSL